jgi:hypothetical protein
MAFVAVTEIAFRFAIAVTPALEVTVNGISTVNSPPALCEAAPSNHNCDAVDTFTVAVVVPIETPLAATN